MRIIFAYEEMQFQHWPGSVLGEKRYLDAASNAAHFILSHNKDKNGALSRRWAKGESKYPAYLEDYSFLIDALIELYQATSEKSWIKHAESLQSKQDTLFLDSKNSGYFNTQSGDTPLIKRKKDFADSVTPSGNSISVLNLLRLSAITFNAGYSKGAEALIKSVPETVNTFPSEFPQLLMAIDYQLDQSKKVALLAEKSDDELKKFKAALIDPFNPNKVLVVGIGADHEVAILKGKRAVQGKPTVYVCLNHLCKLPTTDLGKATALIRTFESYPLR